MMTLVVNNVLSFVDKRDKGKTENGSLKYRSTRGEKEKRKRKKKKQ